MQRTVVMFAGLGLIAVALLGFEARGGLAGEGLRYFAGALVGGLAGFALYHAAFGFTAAWRRMTRERRGGGLRAQMALIALTCAVTYLLIGYEDLTGWNMHPVILPMGIASAFGAFVFGIGMQLGGGCASGTLVHGTGGGSSRMLLVLVFFIAGSVWATAHIPSFWREVPAMTGVPEPAGHLADGREFGADRGARGAPWPSAPSSGPCPSGSRSRRTAISRPVRKTRSVLHGEWSLLLGAVGAGRGRHSLLPDLLPPLGRDRRVCAVGRQTAGHPGRAGRPSGPIGQGWRKAQVEGSLFANRTSLMNFGIVFGAMLAAALAGRFRPTLALSRRDVITAVIGGLLMGYGARLAGGCNIGAYLGGIVSGSLHGWWWLVWGFAGSLIGTRLRGLLDMDPPLAPRPT